MSLLETMTFGAVTVILTASIYALIAVAKKNRVLGRKFSLGKRTSYIVLLVVIVIWLIVSIVNNGR